MRVIRHFFRILIYPTNLYLYICIIVSLSIKPAYAYLDPGTGSMVLQLLLGGIAGLLLVGKLYLQKIKLFFSKLFGRRTQNENRRDEA